MCPCVEIGCCTHDIECALSRAARATLCRLTVSCGFTSARMRIRRSFTCLVCVSVTATRPCPSRTRHHCNRRRRSGKLRVFVRTDGLTPFICSYLNMCVWMFSRACTHQRSSIHVGSTRAARTPLCRQVASCGFTSARTRIRCPFPCLVCFCHHDTHVPNENTTLLQPSTSLRPSLPPTTLPASDHEDGFTKLMSCSLEVNIQAHVRVNIHASLCCLVGFRHMFASTPWRIHAG